jgi:hypothetical protein
MPKNQQIGWVNNVNNLSTPAGIKSGVSYTGLGTPLLIAHSTNGKLVFVHLFYHLFQALLSTGIFRIFHLLNAGYTHFPHPLLIEPQMKN